LHLHKKWADTALPHPIDPQSSRARNAQSSGEMTLPVLRSSMSDADLRAVTSV
jgi:hypothetical protein